MVNRLSNNINKQNDNMISYPKSIININKNLLVS